MQIYERVTGDNETRSTRERIAVEYAWNIQIMQKCRWQGKQKFAGTNNYQLSFIVYKSFSRDVIEYLNP